jgi:hypothetical protein
LSPDLLCYNAPGHGTINPACSGWSSAFVSPWWGSERQLDFAFVFVFVKCHSQSRVSQSLVSCFGLFNLAFAD